MSSVLAYTIAFDAPESGAFRQMARMLGASAVRTYLDGDLYILKNTGDPLFLLDRKGLEEVYVATSVAPQELAHLGNAWKIRASEVLSPELVGRYRAVLFIDADCLILRNIDHLFERSDWDILYQPEPGLSIQDPVFSAYLTDEEMASPPARFRFGANAGIWAVRSGIYCDVTTAWAEIMDRAPPPDPTWMVQAAWNRLLLDAEKKYGWRTRPFEKHEIQFPLRLDFDWKRYKDAAIVHCMGGNTLEKIQFMFGMYMQTFFHDPKGMVVSLLDM